MKTNQLFRAAAAAKTIKAGIFAAALFCSASVFAQVKIGDNPTVINAGSALEIESTNKGLLMPRVSLSNTTTWGLLGTQVAGMHVYNTNTGITSSNTDYPTLIAKKGEYYWDGTGWVALAPLQKATAISTFDQITPGVLVSVPYTPPGSCPLPVLGTQPSACATDLNQIATFGIDNPVNDVTIDLSDKYTVGNNLDAVYFSFGIYVDKTTPGVYELVGFNMITHSSTFAGCGGGTESYKIALKNLPVRASYSVKVYLIPWNNSGSGNPSNVKIGVGTPAIPGCGSVDFSENKLFVAVSQ
ncbi:hypothetical protein [Dyadobacter sp. 32]|uniref:hypothetical protein n=1 Tax=Dyadobacter sp. 32 TaxID=538966 RepID=UPI0011ECEE6C